jgi:hypothetical protein
MSNTPVRATPHPLLHGFADALQAWFGPSSEPSAARAQGNGRSGALRAAPADARYHARLDMPAYQRRGIRIPGLDDA